jgi:hypothetical protein
MLNVTTTLHQTNKMATRVHLNKKKKKNLLKNK